MQSERERADYVEYNLLTAWILSEVAYARWPLPTNWELVAEIFSRPFLFGMAKPLFDVDLGMPSKTKLNHKQSVDAEATPVIMSL